MTTTLKKFLYAKDPLGGAKEFTLTKDELQDLMDDQYIQGHRDGYDEGYSVGLEAAS